MKIIGIINEWPLLEISPSTKNTEKLKVMKLLTSDSGQIGVNDREVKRAPETKRSPQVNKLLPCSFLQHDSCSEAGPQLSVNES